MTRIADILADRRPLTVYERLALETNARLAHKRATRRAKEDQPCSTSTR